MAKEFGRQQRIAQELKKEVAVILQQKIENLSINVMVTVSSVEVSRDLAYAKIFVTFLSDDKKTVKSEIKKLQNASGFIRAILSKTMYLRIVPKITFFYDISLETGIRISNLINNTVKCDKVSYLSFKTKQQ